MQRILERKRTEKRALENMQRFYCDPKRHWKTPKHPVAPKSAKRRATTPDASPVSSSAPMPRPWGIPTERPTGLYAALQAPATAADRQPRIRRRPKGINAKRLKAAVEKVRKPSVDIWHGGYHPRHGQGGPHALR